MFSGNPRHGMAYLFGALGMVILAVLGGLLLVDNQGRAHQRVLHTVRVERALVEVLERARAFEAAQRGYLISGRSEFVRDFYVAERDLRRNLVTLRRLTADNADQTANYDRLQAILERRIAVARQVVALERGGDGAKSRALASTGPGPALMASATRQVDKMSQIEQQLFRQRNAHAQRLGWVLTAGLIFAMLLVMVLAGLIVLDARRRSLILTAARDAAEEAAAAAREALEGREAAEAKVRQLQKMEAVGQLTGGIAHDFNNMLAIIIGSLELAERHLARDPGRVMGYIGDARVGAERAAMLTDRLLAFSRQQPLSPRVIDANQMVRTMLELLSRTLGEQIRIRTDLAADLWPSVADPGQLENAILNLAVNARDAMPEGGTLIIETGNIVLEEDYAARNQEVHAGEYVMVSIADSGCGMPPEVIGRAFDPFFTTKEVGKGTGLGLSQVYGFMKQSKGHVALYSELGTGTMVKLYLPRHAGMVEGVRAAPIEIADPLPRARPGERVLLVEDEDRVRAFSAEALQELGYEVISAAGGREALVHLEAGEPVTLLFTDVIMPEMNGNALVLAAQALRPDIKVLYTTGYTRNAVVHNGILDPEVVMLTKPFTLSQLARKLRSVIDCED